MNNHSAAFLTVNSNHLTAVTGGNAQGFVDGAKRIGDTVVKGAGYGGAAGGMGGFVVGGPAGAGAGAAGGAALGGAFGLGWGAAREVDNAIHHTGPYAPKK